jgi:glycosyltransferase involved in cell wall biosynthesis
MREAGGPLRVAHVVATAGTTGVESHLLTLLPSFDRSEVEPVLFVPGEGPLVDRMRACNVSVEFGAPTRKLAFRDSGRLARRLAGQFDIVHAHGPRAAFWTAHAARRAKVRTFVATIHELRWQILSPGLRREVWIALEGHAIRSARHLITVSGATRRDLIARWPDLAARTSVVHASAPLLLNPQRVPRAAPGQVGRGPLRLVAVGRFVRVKGYDLLLPALSVLRDRQVQFTIDIVGSGPEETALRAAADRLRLSDRIRWMGPDADVPRVLADADIFVTATRAETFGIAVLEAMAVGLPVVAPAVGSLPELILDDETGILVPAAPERSLPERMAGAITDLAGDPGRRDRLGSAAASRARTVFSPRAGAAAVASIYRALVTDALGSARGAGASAFVIGRRPTGRESDPGSRG